MSRLCIGLRISARFYLKVQAFVLLGLLLWLSLLYKQVLAATNNAAWEAGRLDYVNGSAEVAAFINQEHVQLQVVLCSLNEPSAYRLTLLLSKPPKITGLIPVKLLVDGTTTQAYAEVSGNSLELQVSIPFLISLTYSPSLEVVFKAQDAKALSLPATLHISMEQADLALNEIARSCTLLCQDQDFSCNVPLLSGILWPRQGFDNKGDRAGPSVVIYRQLLGLSQDDESEDWDNDNVDLSNPNIEEDEGTEELSGNSVHNNADFSYAKDLEHKNKDPDIASANIKEETTTANVPEQNKSNLTAQNTSYESAKQEDENDIDLSQDALNHACLQWPRSISGYERSISDMYALTPSFNLNSKCQALLDKRFERDGKWALAFMPEIFKKSGSAYQIYQQNWNVLVKALDPEGKLPDTLLNDDDYYLALFTLFTTTNLHEFPQSYFDLLNFSEDPATFLYAMDNRYDLETIKYYAVLDRRLRGSISLLQTAALCYQIWEEFYQEFSAALPPIPKAQALRPVLFRQMLMRVWRLAGYPDPLHLRPQYAFVQGTGHHTLTSEPLEARCSAFEGSSGDQFFFASPECLQSIYTDLGRQGFLNEDFKQVQLSWDAFAQACQKSNMISLSGGATKGEVSRSGLALSLISLYKLYGFGDYFLLRNCVSTRDKDICAFQAVRARQDYNTEFRNSIGSVSDMSHQDAQTLNNINELWNRYYDNLKLYTDRLVARGRIEEWRAYFIQGVAATTQTESLLSGPYFRQPVEPED